MHPFFGFKNVSKAFQKASVSFGFKVNVGSEILTNTYIL
mgnify:CR=1 FL=1